MRYVHLFGVKYARSIGQTFADENISKIYAKYQNGNRFLYLKMSCLFSKKKKKI